MTTKQNYTDEMVQEIIAEYSARRADEGNESILADLADKYEKTVRSIRGKLVREGVYEKEEAPTKEPVQSGPTKKEMLRALEQYVDFDVEGLMPANKEMIQTLIDAFYAMQQEKYAELDSSEETQSQVA